MSRTYERSYGAVWMLLGLYVVIGALCISREYGDVARDVLSMNRSGLMHGQVWRLVTYAFLSAGSPLNLLFHILVFFYIAAPLEAAWGTRRFMNLFLFSVVGGGLTAAFLGRTLASGWAPATTLLLIHGFMFPQSVIYLFLVLPIRVKTLAIITTAVFLVYCVQEGLAGLAMFAGLFCGVLYYVLVTGALPKVVRFKRKVRATAVHPVEALRNSTGQMLSHAREIMRRRDAGATLTEQDRSFLRELLERGNAEPLCSPYSFSPDNTICPPCRQFGTCLKRYLETAEEEGRKTG